MVQDPRPIPPSIPPNQPYAQNVLNANMVPPHLYSMIPPAYIQGASPPTEYIELVKKMFDFMFKEVRDVRHEQMNQNHVLQETLNRFFVGNSQPSLMSQNIPAIPHNLQKEFYSDAKQHKEYFDRESNLKKKPIPSNESLSIPFGESDNSEFYDKSLSAIASKVPLNHRMNKE
jgi:hypothetical protein